LTSHPFRCGLYVKALSMSFEKRRWKSRKEKKDVSCLKSPTPPPPRLSTTEHGEPSFWNLHKYRWKNGCVQIVGHKNFIEFRALCLLGKCSI
jgi:hypothetical protein